MAQHTDLEEHADALAADAAHGAPDAAGVHGAEAAGLPQLDFSTFPNQIFWLIVALLAIYLILTRVALPRIGGVLAERQGSITNDLAAAEDLKKKAEEAEAAYEKALAEARAEAGRIVDAAKAEMAADLEKATEEADERISEQLAASEARIAEIREGATAAVREVAREAAAEIVALLGGRADDAALDRAVSARTGGAA